MSENGLYFDPDKVVYYTINAFSLKKSKRVHAKSVFPKEFSTIPIANPVLPKDIAYAKWPVDTGTGTVNILDIAGYNSKLETSTPEEDLFLLGITRTELNTLQALPGISDLHDKFFVFEEILNQADAVTGTPYKKYKLKLQGLNNIGDVAVVAPATDIFVYSTGLNMVSSKDFAASSILPDLLPDPGTMKEFEFTGKFFYDANDPFITDLFTDGTVTVKDTGGLDVKAGVIGEIHFPTDIKDGTDLSTKKAPYPCVVIIHGNGHQYAEYRDLCIHLAYNGFVAATINCLTYNASRTATLSPMPSIGPNYYYFTDQDTKYVYSDNNAVPSIDPGNYEYQKLTIIDYPSSTVLNKRLLTSFVKDTDFSVSLATTPRTITFLNKMGEQGMATRGRSNLIFAHLKVLNKKFNIPAVQLANNIGIIGHSRGGEAVVRAAKDIGTSIAPAGLKTLKAIIALAPTDATEKESLTQNIPFYILYGSRDGDARGATIPQGVESVRYAPPPASYRGSGGFSLYDRTNNNTEKAMSFVYKACHNGFITFNEDDLYAVCITATHQQEITKAYMNAFLRMHQKNEAVWKPYFWGEFIPASVTEKKIYPQYKKMSTDTKVIQDFDGIAIGTFTQSTGITKTIGDCDLKMLTFAPAGATYGGVTAITDNNAARIDQHSPHETKAMKVKWAASETLTLTLPDAGVNVSALKCLSFRIAIVPVIPPGLHDLDLAPAGTYSSLDQLKIRLKDNANSHESVISRKIPAPDARETRQDDKVGATILPVKVLANYTKSAMMTIRMDLANYANAGVDLTKITELTFVFPPSGDGHVIIDEILFSN